MFSIASADASPDKRAGMTESNPIKSVKMDEFFNQSLLNINQRTSSKTKVENSAIGK
jgi:hypothetical protein